LAFVLVAVVFFGSTTAVVVEGALVFGVTTGAAAAPVEAAGLVAGKVVLLPELGAGVELPTLELGELAGVAAGSVVIGVGSGGNGFDKALAITSFKPASDWLCLNLYQVVKLSSHCTLLA
jgi:hypothetical protein